MKFQLLAQQFSEFQFQLMLNKTTLIQCHNLKVHGVKTNGLITVKLLLSEWKFLSRHSKEPSLFRH